MAAADEQIPVNSITYDDEKSALASVPRGYFPIAFLKPSGFTVFELGLYSSLAFYIISLVFNLTVNGRVAEAAGRAMAQSLLHNGFTFSSPRSISSDEYEWSARRPQCALSINLAAAPRALDVRALLAHVRRIAIPRDVLSITAEIQPVEKSALVGFVLAIGDKSMRLDKVSASLAGQKRFPAAPQLYTLEARFEHFRCLDAVLALPAFSAALRDPEIASAFIELRITDNADRTASPPVPTVRLMLHGPKSPHTVPSWERVLVPWTNAVNELVSALLAKKLPLGAAEASIVAARADLARKERQLEEEERRKKTALAAEMKFIEDEKRKIAAMTPDQIRAYKKLRVR